MPTSSSKYPDMKSPHTKVSIKGSGWKSYKPREPVRTVSSYHPDLSHFRDPRTIGNIPVQVSPIPQEIQHSWEEGTKRPKTQNEKCRRKNSTQGFASENTDVFPNRNCFNGNKMYEIPIIVIRDDKTRRVVSAKRNVSSNMGQRPATFKPGKSNLISSLDKEFLDLFQM